MIQERIRRLPVYILILTYIFISGSFFATVAYASELYSNGYFRYTVEDYSVTIISYTGTESEVNVPNMIAGNPVNVIAKGAFAKNKSAKKINLPDTIMSVEEGAFAEGQSVIYDFEDNANVPDNNPEDNKTSEENVETNEQKSDRKETESRVTVDTDNNLIFVDINGNETVLDDSRDYRKTTDENGNDVIEDTTGNIVVLTDDGYVEYIDKDNNKASVDTKTGNKTFESENGSYSYEEIQIEDISSSKSQPQDKETSNEEKAGKKNDNIKNGIATEEENSVSENKYEEIRPAETEEFPLVTVIIIVVAIALVAYIVLFRRRKE